MLTRHKMTDRHFDRMRAVFSVRNLPQDGDIYSKEAVLASLKFQKLLATLESALRADLKEKDKKEGKLASPARFIDAHSIDQTALVVPGVKRKGEINYGLFSEPIGEHHWMYTIKTLPMWTRAKDPAKEALAAEKEDSLDFSGTFLRTLKSIVALRRICQTMPISLYSQAQ